MLQLITRIRVFIKCFCFWLFVCLFFTAFFYVFLFFSFFCQFFFEMPYIKLMVNIRFFFTQVFLYSSVPVSGNLLGITPSSLTIDNVFLKPTFPILFEFPASVTWVKVNANILLELVSINEYVKYLALCLGLSNLPSPLK